VLEDDLVVARVDAVADPERVEPLLGLVEVRALEVGECGGSRGVCGPRRLLLVAAPGEAEGEREPDENHRVSHTCYVL
jgi:hypothetical protein